MLYFYAYPTRHNDGIIVSSIPIKKGESWKIKTKKRINRKSTEPEYQTFLQDDNGSLIDIQFGMVTFIQHGNEKSGLARELNLKMGDPIHYPDVPPENRLKFSNVSIDWNSYEKKYRYKTSKELVIANFFKSFYWVD